MKIRNAVTTNPSEDESMEVLPSASVLEVWNPNLRVAVGTETMADEDDANSISIFDTIGGGFFSEGVTAKRIDAALRRIGNNDVVVNINSPGGIMFEGFTIYNLLKNHRGSVTVNVLGIAASAASVIAMAGDEIVMNTGSQMMIHNPAACICGDYRDFAEASQTLQGFRDSAIEIYAAQTSMSDAALRKLMDRETFMGSKEAVDKGFATTTQDIKTREAETGATNFVSDRSKLMGTLKVALAREGFTRKERSAMFQQLGFAASMTEQPAPAASMTGSPEGDLEVIQALKKLNETMKG